VFPRNRPVCRQLNLVRVTSASAPNQPNCNGHHGRDGFSRGNFLQRAEKPIKASLRGREQKTGTRPREPPPRRSSPIWWLLRPLRVTGSLHGFPLFAVSTARKYPCSLYSGCFLRAARVLASRPRDASGMLGQNVRQRLGELEKRRNVRALYGAGGRPMSSVYSEDIATMSTRAKTTLPDTFRALDRYPLRFCGICKPERADCAGP
jgi:hypothetical protein